MSTVKYEPVIGLEVHCQLQTASKAFSPDSATFGAGPNQHVDQVSLGHPGTLPVANARVIDYSIKMGLVTNCTIAPRSVFARKHYFYPDLPKGYQISQFETPICADGFLEILDDQEPEAGLKRIGITRIHMEEDAGKSIHDQDPLDTLMDYNRCGVPLIEIVSEPDIRTPHEAYLYMQRIRQFVRYLGICDGNMEEGSLRCDANVSVRPVGQEAFGTKTEVKNMNSFRNVERAIAYEIKRQIALIESGGEVVQETLLWDVDAQKTRTMRSKELAHDYRYFPDPDLVPLVVEETQLEEIRAGLPMMPAARIKQYTESLGLPRYDAEVLTEERPTADYFEATLKAYAAKKPDADQATAAKTISNIVMTSVLRVLNEQHLSIVDFPITPENMAGLVDLRLDNKISSSGAQTLFDLMLEDAEAPEALAASHNLLQVSDTGALLPVVQQVLADNPGQLAAFRGGKAGLIGYFIGQVMKTFPGSPDPKLVRQMILEQIEATK
ncbi:MAG: Asp-tRNA(Asn)/Glu-tRNA(Gln) amidotransferase subunit GatB [Bacteroidota bacterium]